MNEIIKCWWRPIEGGWQLSCGMWWVACAKTSQVKPGMFYWKIFTGEFGYSDSIDEAKKLAQEFVLNNLIQGDKYEIIDKTKPRAASAESNSSILPHASSEDLGGRAAYRSGEVEP